MFNTVIIMVSNYQLRVWTKLKTNSIFFFCFCGIIFFIQRGECQEVYWKIRSNCCDGIHETGQRQVQSKTLISPKIHGGKSLCESLGCALMLFPGTVHFVILAKKKLL